MSQKLCIFPIGGQSNAAGQAERRGPDVPFPVQVYSIANGWSYGNDPLPHGGLGSPWPAFGSEFYNLTGETIMFVQTAFNGGYQCDVNRNITPNNPVASWDVQGTAVPNAFAEIDAALAWAASLGIDARVCGMNWFQGESEGNGISWYPNIMNKQIYKTALKTMIDRFQTRYTVSGAPKLPFYIFQTGMPRVGSAASISAGAGYSQVRDAQEETAKEMPGVMIATRLALQSAFRQMMVDDVHYNQDANNEMGMDAARRVVASGLWNRWS